MAGNTLARSGRCSTVPILDFSSTRVYSGGSRIKSRTPTGQSGLSFLLHPFYGGVLGIRKDPADFCRESASPPRTVVGILKQKEATMAGNSSARSGRCSAVPILDFSSTRVYSGGSKSTRRTPARTGGIVVSAPPVLRGSVGYPQGPSGRVPLERSSTPLRVVNLKHTEAIMAGNSSARSGHCSAVPVLFHPPVPLEGSNPIRAEKSNNQGGCHE